MSEVRVVRAQREATWPIGAYGFYWSMSIAGGSK